jgi:hypothetical protein
MLQTKTQNSKQMHAIHWWSPKLSLESTRETARETTRETSATLELEATTSATLLEHEPLSSATKWRALEGVASLSAGGVVGIVALVEALPELGV